MLGKIIVVTPSSLPFIPDFLIQGTVGDDLALLVRSYVSIATGDGNDIAIGLGYGDSVYMGDGNDIAIGGYRGGFVAFGGDGDDRISVAGGKGNLLDGGTGADTLIGGTGDDTLICDARDPTILGGGGNNTFRIDPYESDGGIIHIGDFKPVDYNNPHDTLDFSGIPGLTPEEVMIFNYINEVGIAEQVVVALWTDWAGQNHAIGVDGVKLTGGVYDAIADGSLVFDWDGKG